MRSFFESFSPSKKKDTPTSSWSSGTIAQSEQYAPHFPSSSSPPHLSHSSHSYGTRFVAVAPGSGNGNGPGDVSSHHTTLSTQRAHTTHTTHTTQDDLEEIYDDFHEYVDCCEEGDDDEDLDAMELGYSQNLLADELYLPCHPSRDWIRCYVSSTGPDTFRLYLEGKKRVRFLLSAKQFVRGGEFFISSHEDFPYLERAPQSETGFVARLEKQAKDRSFLLSLTHCHLCDHKLGLYSCGRGPREREVVAKISHSFKEQRPWGLQCRTVSVSIPSFSRDGAKRKIWCPRSFRHAFGESRVGVDVDLSAALALDTERESFLALRNQTPQWNSELQSLVVRFHGNRVLAASAKNFLLCVHDSERERERDVDIHDVYARSRTRTRTDTSSSLTSTTTAHIVYESEHEEQERERERERERAGRVRTRERLHSHTTISVGSAKTHSFATVHTVHKSRSRTQSTATTTSTAGLPPAHGGESEKQQRRKRAESDLHNITHSLTPHTINRKAMSSSQPNTSVNSSAHTFAMANSVPNSATVSPHSQQSLKKCSSASNAAMVTLRSLNSNEPQPVLQFGKCSMTRFVLDFKYPLSPLQAFGIALAAFANDEPETVAQSDIDHYVEDISSEADDAAFGFADFT